MTDPFADDFETETKTDAKETKTVTVTPEDNQGKLTITLKGGAGFDAPWIVIHAADAEDGLKQMQDAQLKDLMDVVKRAGSHFSGGNGSAGRPQHAPQQSAKPPQQQAPSGEGKSCQHGEMVFRSGVSQKTGKPWKGYFCPTPKGTPDQCSAEFIR